MPTVVIRRAGAGDAEVLADIGRRTFAETFGHLYPPEDLSAFLRQTHDVKVIRAELADPALAAWLAIVDDQVAGYAQAGPCGLPHPEATPESGELKRLYVLGAHQNRGVGGQLFAHAMAWLARTGSRDLWIGVWSENHGARRFYARHGFEPVGEYGFKVGTVTDHELILRRDDATFPGPLGGESPQSPRTAQVNSDN